MRIILNSEYVEYLIARRNRTKQWFAVRVGVSNVYLSLWFSHQRNPGPDSRRRIVRVLRGPGVTWEKLFLCKNDDTTTSFDAS